MTRDFEKYFPLPLSYDAVRGEMKTYGGIVVMQPSLGLMSSEQAEYADDFARHLVLCANLMPEAELALRRARAALTRVCTHCECEDKACGDCIVRAANDCAKNCLTKLDAGYEREEDAKDVESHS